MKKKKKSGSEENKAVHQGRMGWGIAVLYRLPSEDLTDDVTFEQGP